MQTSAPSPPAADESSPSPAPTVWPVWLLCLPIGLTLFGGIWFALDVLTTLFNAHAWATNDHLLQGTLADPLIRARLCVTLAGSVLGIAAVARPFTRWYTKLRSAIRWGLLVIAVVTGTVSSCMLLLGILLVLLQIFTPPWRASTEVDGYRIHLVQRGTDDLDFSELVVSVTRADGAFYEQQLQLLSQGCQELTTTTTDTSVTLRCSRNHTAPILVIVDRQQQTIQIPHESQPARPQSLSTLPYTIP